MKRPYTCGVLSVCVILSAQFLYGQEVVSWQECVQYAQQNNPSLKSSRESLNKSRAGTGIARSAYLPQINASAGASADRSINKTTGGWQDTLTATQNLQQLSGNRSNSTITNSFNYGISGKQMIFDGMKTIYDIKSAENAADDAFYQFYIKSAQVRLDLRTAFIELLKAQESVDITKQIIEIRAKNYNLVKMRYLAGREHKGSLMDAEASLAQARYNFQQAERTIISAQRSLLNVMGIYSYINIKAQGTLNEKNPTGEKPDFDLIVKTHPTVLSARKQREAAVNYEKSRMAAFSPVISAAGSIGQTLSETTGSRPNTVNLQAGLYATMPLVTGGSNYYNLAQAKAQSRKLEADEAVIRDQVVTNLEQYWIGWQNAIDTVEVQRKYLAAAEERARIAEAEYSMGLVVYDIWITIEDQLVQRKLTYLEARANQLVAEAKWIQAKGETLAYDK